MAPSDGESAEDILCQWKQEFCDSRQLSPHILHNSIFNTCEKSDSMASRLYEKTIVQTDSWSTSRYGSASTSPSFEWQADPQPSITPDDSASANLTQEPSLSRPASSQFSASVKRQIARYYPGGNCWACGWEEDVEHCHVIAISDTQVDKWIQAKAFPPRFNRAAASNGVILCPNCHKSYDRAIDPGFVFFPTDLEYFINYELKDARERNTEGSKSARRVPTASDYRRYQEIQELISPGAAGGLYRRVYFNKAGEKLMRRMSGPKIWHGEPMYTIRRAIHILGTPQINRLPETIRGQLSQLRDLYFIQDPQGYCPPLLASLIERSNWPSGPPSYNQDDGGDQGGLPGDRPLPKRHATDDPEDDDPNNGPSPSKRQRGELEVNMSHNPGQEDLHLLASRHDWINDWLLSSDDKSEDAGLPEDIPSDSHREDQGDPQSGFASPSKRPATQDLWSDDPNNTPIPSKPHLGEHEITMNCHRNQGRFYPLAGGCGWADDWLLGPNQTTEDAVQKLSYVFSRA